MVQRIELIAKNDIAVDIKFAKVQFDNQMKIQVTFGYMNKYFHYKSMKPI